MLPTAALKRGMHKHCINHHLQPPTLVVAPSVSIRVLFVFITAITSFFYLKTSRASLLSSYTQQHSLDNHQIKVYTQLRAAESSRWGSHFEAWVPLPFCCWR